MSSTISISSEILNCISFDQNIRKTPKQIILDGSFTFNHTTPKRVSPSTNGTMPRLASKPILALSSNTIHDSDNSASTNLGLNQNNDSNNMTPSFHDS